MSSISHGSTIASIGAMRSAQLVYDNIMCGMYMADPVGMETSRFNLASWYLLLASILAPNTIVAYNLTLVAKT